MANRLKNSAQQRDSTCPINDTDAGWDQRYDWMAGWDAAIEWMEKQGFVPKEEHRHN